MKQNPESAIRDARRQRDEFLIAASPTGDQCNPGALTAKDLVVDGQSAHGSSWHGLFPPKNSDTRNRRLPGIPGRSGDLTDRDMGRDHDARPPGGVPELPLLRDTGLHPLITKLPSSIQKIGPA